MFNNLILKNYNPTISKCMQVFLEKIILKCKNCEPRVKLGSEQGSSVKHWNILGKYFKLTISDTTNCCSG